MSVARPFSMKVLLAAVACLVSVLTPLALGRVASASSRSLCQQVTSGEVSKALGVKAPKVTKDVNGYVTVCWYQVGANPQAVFIRSQTHDSVTGFNADRKAATAQHEDPKTDPSFKPNPAFSTLIGSATYGFTYSLTVLKGHVELVVGASNVALVRVEGLARKVLPIL